MTTFDIIFRCWLVGWLFCITVGFVLARQKRQCFDDAEEMIRQYVFFGWCWPVYLLGMLLGLWEVISEFLCETLPKTVTKLLLGRGK